MAPSVLSSTVKSPGLKIDALLSSVKPVPAATEAPLPESFVNVPKIRSPGSVAVADVLVTLSVPLAVATDAFDAVASIGFDVAKPEYSLMSMARYGTEPGKFAVTVDVPDVVTTA